MNDALLVIDVQNEYFTGSMPVTYPQGSLENILKAMDRAHAVCVPVVVIQHTNVAQDAVTSRKGTGNWELNTEIKQRHADILIGKKPAGEFYRYQSRELAEGAGYFKGYHRRLHDPDVLRYDRSAGISSWICSGLPVRCNRHPVSHQYRRNNQ